MQLIENASQWYLMHSAQALVAIGGIQATLATVPEAWKATPVFHGYTVADAVNALTIVAAVLGFIGRLVSQPKLATGPGPSTIIPTDPKA